MAHSTPRLKTNAPTLGVTIHSRKPLYLLAIIIVLQFCICSMKSHPDTQFYIVLTVDILTAVTWITVDPEGKVFIWSVNWLHCTAGTSRSRWTSSWASSQKSSSWQACLATSFCSSSTSGQPTMPSPPRTLPACWSTSSTCVFSTTTTPRTNPSTGDRCSLPHQPLCLSQLPRPPLMHYSCSLLERWTAAHIEQTHNRKY